MNLILEVIFIIALRQEAIQLALQRRQEQEGGQNPVCPAPTKRQSFVVRRQNEVTGPDKRPHSSYQAPTTFHGNFYCISKSTP